MRETTATTSDDSMTDRRTTSVELEIEKVSSFIIAARRLLSDNRIVNVSTLEEKVIGLCDAVRDVSHDDRDHVLLAMENMIENLDRLAAELSGQNRTMVSQVDIAPSLKSLDAYVKSTE